MVEGITRTKRELSALHWEKLNWKLELKRREYHKIAKKKKKQDQFLHCLSLFGGGGGFKMQIKPNWKPTIQVWRQKGRRKNNNTSNDHQQ